MQGEPLAPDRLHPSDEEHRCCTGPARGTCLAVLPKHTPLQLFLSFSSSVSFLAPAFIISRLCPPVCFTAGSAARPCAPGAKRHLLLRPLPARVPGSLLCGGSVQPCQPWLPFPLRSLRLTFTRLLPCSLLFCICPCRCAAARSTRCRCPPGIPARSEPPLNPGLSAEPWLVFVPCCSKPSSSSSPFSTRCPTSAALRACERPHAPAARAG